MEKVGSEVYFKTGKFEKDVLTFLFYMLLWVICLGILI